MILDFLWGEAQQALTSFVMGIFFIWAYVPLIYIERKDYNN